MGLCQRKAVMAVAMELLTADRMKTARPNSAFPGGSYFGSGHGVMRAASAAGTMATVGLGGAAR